jgi:hypothetical protein
MGTRGSSLEARPCRTVRHGLVAPTSTNAKVAFEITGLPDSAESTATFTVPFKSELDGEGDVR